MRTSVAAREVWACYKKEECTVEIVRARGRPCRAPSASLAPLRAAQVMRLPAAYPLRHVEVEFGRSVGIAKDRSRRWMLQIRALLSHQVGCEWQPAVALAHVVASPPHATSLQLALQDGSLADAVVLWRENVARELAGVEPCPICYSVVHMASRSLPRLSCHTCHTKFHPACLYKWFSSSHKSTCPMCRQPVL